VTGETLATGGSVGDSFAAVWAAAMYEMKAVVVVVVPEDKPVKES
jgi:hypothetical protein